MAKTTGMECPLAHRVSRLIAGTILSENGIMLSSNISTMIIEGLKSMHPSHRFRLIHKAGNRKIFIIRILDGG